MVRPTLPPKTFRLPDNRTIRPGDLYYNYALRAWVPVSASVGYRVDYWGMVIARPYWNFQIKLTGFSEFIEAVRKAASSFDELQRSLSRASLRPTVAGEGRTTEDTHRVEGGVLEGLR